jgi:hypothetical protein
MGFSHIIFDHSLLIDYNGSDMTYILIYVDDIILPASSESLCENIMSKMSFEFAMKDLGSQS